MDLQTPRELYLPSVWHSMIKLPESGHLALAWRSDWTGWKYLTLALSNTRTEKDELFRARASEPWAHARMHIRTYTRTHALTFEYVPARVARVVCRCRSGLTYVCSSCSTAVSLTSAAHTSFHVALTHAANQPVSQPTNQPTNLPTYLPTHHHHQTLVLLPIVHYTRGRL